MHNDLPLISIVIPLYNAEDYIEATVESVLNQTYPNWEMIVVDDCSTDNSRQLVSRLSARDGRIKLIESQENFGGPARPRNIGVRQAKGEYVAFLDADDLWDPKKLEKQVEFLQKNNINFSSSGCILIDESAKPVKAGLKSLFLDRMTPKQTLCDLIKENFILTSSVIIKKAELLEFSERKEFIAVEDFDLWLRILGSETVRYKYQNESLMQYRLVHNSISERSHTLRQELKANLVVASFLLSHEHCLGCYLKRVFAHLFLKKIKKSLIRQRYNKNEKGVL